MFCKKIFSSLSVLLFVLFSACSEKLSFEIAKDTKVAVKSASEKDGGTIVTRFLFNESDLRLLNSKLKTSFSLEFVFENGGSPSGAFSFGFIDSSSSEVEKVVGDFGGIPSSKIRFSIVEKKLPSGFFIKSGLDSGKISLKSLKVLPVKIGFDFSSIPSFYFSSKGGKITAEEISSKTIDFSDVEFRPNMLFRAGFSDSADSTGRTATVMSVNKEKFYLRKPNGSSSIEFSPLAVKNPSGVVSFIENREQLSSFVLVPSSKYSEPKFVEGSSKRYVLTPIVTDPGLIMWWPKKNWRGDDYELFVWDRFPGVVILDIADYAVQDDFFRRIAFFVEKAGFRGKLYSDSFLEDKHGYNAHDYRAESLAEFYEKVRQENFPINEKERLLKRILIENGVLVEKPDGRVEAGKGAVISISQQSQMYLRTQFIAHEGWHGIFFLDSDFRKTVYKFYDELDEGTKRYLIRYFQVTPSLNYDVNDPYLLRNEFMAYMLQKPVSDIAEYFLDMAGRRHSQDLAKREADYIIATGARHFVDASRKLDEYVNGRWNLDAGRVWLVN
nr:hypothetical protein [Treponema sp.]